MDAEIYIEILKGLGPLGVLVGVVVYLLLRERNNKKAGTTPATLARHSSTGAGSRR